MGSPLTSSTLPPNPLVASIFAVDATSGITTTQSEPTRAAAHDSACAWFPVDTGECHLVGDVLHRWVVQAHSVGEHRELVSRERAVGEDVEVEIVACQVSVSAVLM
jgi:hypothetical protein